MPERIQRRRTRGWKMPEGAVYVGRPTKWGNPYRVSAPDPLTGAPMDAAAAVFWYRAGLDPLVSKTANAERTAIKESLRGRDLICWCRLHSPCHADVLLELANAPTCEAVDAS